MTLLRKNADRFYSTKSAINDQSAKYKLQKMVYIKLTCVKRRHVKPESNKVRVDERELTVTRSWLAVLNAFTKQSYNVLK